MLGMPASARRSAATEPEKPDPITTALFEEPDELELLSLQALPNATAAVSMEVLRINTLREIRDLLMVYFFLMEWCRIVN